MISLSLKLEAKPEVSHPWKLCIHFIINRWITFKTAKKANPFPGLHSTRLKAISKQFPTIYLPKRDANVTSIQQSHHRPQKFKILAAPNKTKLNLEFYLIHHHTRRGSVRKKSSVTKKRCKLAPWRDRHHFDTGKKKKSPKIPNTFESVQRNFPFFRI